MTMKRLGFLLLALASALPAVAHPDAAHSLAELERHLAETPDVPNLHLRKAELLIRRSHPNAARPSVERALALAPEDPETVLLQVRLAHAEKDLPQALAAARETTRRFPDFAAGWKWLARIEKENGGTDEAITAKLRHLSFPDSVDPGDFLTAAAWLRERNGGGDAVLALDTLDQAVARFGPIITVQQTAIQLEISLSRYDPALARVAAMVRKYGPAASSSLLRADIHEAAGRHAEAASACDSAIALIDAQAGGSSPELARHRAEILLRKEAAVKKAERDIEQSRQK